MRFCFVILLIFASLAYSQNLAIEGFVNDVSRQPLVGVNVSIQNTNLGTSTNDAGRFRISHLPAGKYTLQFSFVGYATQKRSVMLSRDTVFTVKLTQTILDGPIVSATATRADARKSAVTFSEVDKKELTERYNTQDVPEMLSELPSTTFYSENGNGIGYNYLSIRGFDQRRISVMVNGIPQNDPEDHNIYWLDFPDLLANVNSIQVQRGAGNAFYGPAAIGGSINIQTDFFSPQRRMSASYGYGSYNTKKASLELNSGLLGGKYLLYGRVSNIKSDGYRERAWTDFWSYFIGAARYTDNSRLRIHFFGGPIKDGLAYGGLPKVYNSDDNLRRKNLSYFEISDATGAVENPTERRSDEIENFNQPHFEILHEWHINDNLTLNNSLFYVNGYGFFDYDGSWGTADYFRLTPEYGFDSSLIIPSDALIRAYVDNNQFGWLPQLCIKTDQGDMTVGAEVRIHRSLHWGRLQKGSGLPDNVAGDGARRYYQYKGAKDIYSFYFHHNYKYSEDLTLQADLQYTYKQYHLYNEKFIGTDFTVPYDFLNPRLGLNYNINSRNNIYTSIYSTEREPRLKNLYDAAEATGGKTPQFELNKDGSYNFDKPLVKPEILGGLEFGWGYNGPRGSLVANVYYMSFKDEIVKSGGVDRFGQPVTGNAEHTRHLGVELNVRKVLTPQLMASGNVNVSKNELVRYKQFGADSTVYILDGNPIAGFPDLLANIRLTYNWHDFYFSLSGRYVGEQYTDNFKNDKNKTDAFTLFNLNARVNLSAIGLPGASLQGRINNLLDTKYLAYGEGIAFFPGATRNFFVGLKYEY